MSRAREILAPVVLLACGLAALGCGGNEATTSQAAVAANPAPSAAPQAGPAADTTGGFDGQRAYQYVSDIVAFGPHSAGTQGDQRVQAYIVNKLQSFGCPVDQEDFHSQTPIGTVAMKNIVAKIPGASPDLLMFTTHYDSLRLDNFVGADDGGSSTSVMLEFARLVCQRKNAMTIWIVFFDAEEAFVKWSDTDSTYGSRELAARMALSGDIGRVKAFLLADLVGGHNLHASRDSNSTPWLTDMVWSTAQRLGYQKIFLSQGSAIEDDHLPFVARKVPVVDIIDLDTNNDIPYWHTPEDTLDKISPGSLAVIGHVLIETLPQLEQKFHPSNP